TDAAPAGATAQTVNFSYWPHTDLIGPVSVEITLPDASYHRSASRRSSCQSIRTSADASYRRPGVTAGRLAVGRPNWTMPGGVPGGVYTATPRPLPESHSTSAPSNACQPSVPSVNSELVRSSGWSNLYLISTPRSSGR